MNRQVIELRRELAARTSGTQYNPTLRAEVAAYGNDRRRTGATWTTIAGELGLNLETLRVWCLSAQREKRVRLRSVEVVPDAKGPGLAVVSPAGFRVEGLTLESAAMLLRAIG